jgi:hypothetical protein
MAAKPQLVVTDMSGHHATNMPETISRLQRGGSWKKQRIVVVLPAADLVPAKCVLSWWNLAFPPNNGVVKIVALGQEVGDAYSTVIEQILAHPDLSQWEYLLTLEHDNSVPSDGVIRLLDSMESHPEFSAISALYFTKGFAVPKTDRRDDGGTDLIGGGCAQIWGSVGDSTDPNFRPQVPRADGGLQECAGIGMGMGLWRISMFKDERIPRPWFRTKRGLNGEGIGTQDLVFCGEARKLGYRFAVDTSVKSGHYDLAGNFGPPDTMY